MSSLSTHVLDATTGTPAIGLHVTLRRDAGPAGWVVLGEHHTDSDGRVRTLADDLEPAVYQLRFDTGGWFAATGRTGFYPEVTVTFEVEEPRHYHVPLLLSPYAFSTYRGS